MKGKAVALVHKNLKIENLRAQEWWDNNGIIAFALLSSALGDAVRCIVLRQANTNCHPKYCFVCTANETERVAYDVRAYLRFSAYGCLGVREKQLANDER